MILLAIDPGDTESAYVATMNGEIVMHAKRENNIILNEIIPYFHTDGVTHVAIEMIASYGMPVGKTVFDTCVWIGRFMQKSQDINKDIPVDLVYRKDVKMHLCGSMKAKDGNIRQALIDKFGAPGTVKNKGKTYGITKDIWAALGVAVTYFETKMQ